MRALSVLVAVMVVLMAAAAGDEKKTGEPKTKGASRRWKMPPRLAPEICNPGQSHTPPDAARWMRYECWRLQKDDWLFVYAEYRNYQQGEKICTPKRPTAKQWDQLALFPGYLFSSLTATRWYCLHHGGVGTEADTREKLADYKGWVGRDGTKRLELKKEEAFVRHTNYLPLVSPSGRPIKTDGLDFRMMNEKVLLTFRYDRRPAYVPKGKEGHCPLPFSGTVASFGPSRKQIASATFSTDGIDMVKLGRFKDGSYLLQLLDSHTEACRQGAPGWRTHFFVWSPEGALLDWKTFKGASAEWQDDYRPPNPVPMCVIGADPNDHSLADDYGVKWDGKKLRRVEGRYCPMKQDD